MTPGIYPLPPNVGDVTDFSVTGPATLDGLWVEGFAGARGLNAQVNFLYGSGSGGVRVCVQSSLDQGFTYYDVALAYFAATSRKLVFAVIPSAGSFFTPGQDGTPGNSPPTAEGVLCPVLGDMLKAKVFVSGTYQNTTVSVRVSPIE